MRITDAPEVTELILEDFAERITAPRSGIHLSDLDLCLGKAFYRKTAPLPATEEQLMYYVRGQAIQEWALAEKEVKQEHDGIQMSLDSPLAGRFLEFKTTAASAKEFDPAKPHWMRRLMGYCKWFGGNTAYLTVYFLFQNRLQSWKFTFIEKELALNWKDILARKERLIAAIKAKTYPEPDEHEAWECNSCENNVPGRCALVRAGPPVRKEKKQ